MLYSLQSRNNKQIMSGHIMATIIFGGTLGVEPEWSRRSRIHSCSRPVPFNPADEMFLRKRQHKPLFDHRIEFRSARRVSDAVLIFDAPPEHRRLTQFMRDERLNSLGFCA